MVASFPGVGLLRVSNRLAQTFGVAAPSAASAGEPWNPGVEQLLALIYRASFKDVGSNDWT